MNSNSLFLLEQYIKELSQAPSFKHSTWFYSYHLKIVEQLVEELLVLYPEANKEYSRALIWLHDLGKIMSSSDPDKTTLIEGEKILKQFGYTDDETGEILHLADMIDSLDDFNNAPIEVKILSSADGGSHFIGPFFSVYYKECNLPNLSDIFLSNIKKCEKDWNKKIVLPEVKKVIEKRYLLTREINGEIPNKLLD